MQVIMFVSGNLSDKSMKAINILGYTEAADHLMVFRSVQKLKESFQTFNAFFTSS